MKPTLLASVGVAAVALTGCGTTAPPRTAAAPSISMAALGPADASGSDGVYFFGAGDALGQQIFTVYVASLELEPHYATGANDFPTE